MHTSISKAAIWLFFLVIFAIHPVPAGAAEDRGGKRIALVIGNDKYQKVRPLEKARNDASAMARELKSAGFEVLEHHDLDYRATIKAVETLANRITGGDQVVVFFAGHGVQIRSGSFLLPVDIDASSELEVEKTAYGLNDLMDRLHEARAGFTLVMIDACRDNPIKSNGRSVGGTRGLAPIEPPKGQMVIFSASRGQQALDRMGEADTNPNGVFTREFIARMRKPGVKVDDLMREVQDSVESLARTISHEQRPAIYNETRGNFYFFGPTTVVNQAAPTLTRARTVEEIEDGYWDAIKDASSANAFAEYLRVYPKGRYAALANSKLATLRGDPRRALPSPIPAAGNRSDPDSALWSAVEQGGSAEEYEVYLKQYPKGKYAPLARQRQQKLKDEARVQAEAAEQTLWDSAGKAQTLSAYNAYLAAYPNGRYAALAQTRVTQLTTAAAAKADEEAWQTAEKTRTASAYEDYQRAFPRGRYVALVPERLTTVVSEAAAREEDKQWETAQKAASRSAMQAYISRYPSGRYVDKARAKDDEYQRTPPRPALPFTVSEANWQMIENSEMYRNLPAPRATTVASDYQSQSEYTGSKSRSLPAPAPMTGSSRTSTRPLNSKCWVSEARIQIDTTQTLMDVYMCGDIQLGQVHGGKVYMEAKLKSISGSLYPPRLGAEQTVAYSGLNKTNPEFSYDQSSTCRITGQRPASELDARLTGTAWQTVCSSKLVWTGGHKGAPVDSQFTDYLLPEAGVRLSMIGAIFHAPMRAQMPQLGVREKMLVAEGEYGSTMWQTYSRHEWKIGEAAP